MGCDIHFFVERRKRGRWGEVYKKEKVEIRYPKGKPYVYYTNYYGYRGRNYDLFAILAGVRNYNDIQPISEPRGLPDDVCKPIKKESDAWDCDGHSHSYLTLKELLNFDWEQGYLATAVMGHQEFDRWDKKSCPDSYCRGISGANVVDISQAEYGRLKSLGQLDPTITYAIQVTWKDSYKDAVKDGEFFKKTIPRLKDLMREQDLRPEDIRIVFWFDN
jgi:hypothetical protein